MSNEGTVGLVIGGLLGLSTRNRIIRRDVRDNERDIDDAERQIRRIKSLGSMKRSAAAPMADLTVGINIPVTNVPTVPGAFATNPPPIARPAINEEDLITGVNEWPFPTNAYDAQGNLINPASVQDGGFVLVGQSLGYSEVLALLAGHTRETQPSNDTIREIFRHYQAFRQVLAEILVTNGGLHSPEFFAQAWRRFFAGVSSASGIPSGLVWSLASDSAAVTSATAEQTFVDVPIPAGLLAVGEAAVVKFFSQQQSGATAADLDLNVYLNGTLIGSITEAGGSGERFAGEVQIIRRPDAGSPASGQFATGTVLIVDSNERAAPQASVVTMDPSVANVLSIRGLWSVAGNTQRLAGATLVKL